MKPLGRIVHSFVLNMACAHHNRAPSRQRRHTLKGRSGGLAPFVRSLVLNTARAHHRSFVRSQHGARAPQPGPRPDRKDTPSKGGAVVWEPSPRAAPSAPYQTASRAGLPVKPRVAAPRCAKVSCHRSRLFLRRPPAAAPARVDRRRSFVRSSLYNTARAHYPRASVSESDR